MKTFAQLLSTATQLAQNVSAANQSLLALFLDESHRILIQDYFDNERTYTSTTVGSQSLTLTAPLSAGATSATLASRWAYATALYLVTFSDGEQQMVQFTYNSTAISWVNPLIGSATNSIQLVGVAAYNIGPYVSKLTNLTVTVGQIKYQPVPIMTRQDWDLINTLPYNSDIPAYFFVYNGQVNLFPIPATTGYIISFNYKTRVPDLTYAWNADWSAWTPGNTPVDYGDGTIGMTQGSTTVTGTSTSWNTTGAFPLNVSLSFASLYLKATPPKGDGFWYQIQQFNSDTSLTLVNPVVNAPNIASGGSYLIGQIPLLFEDFQLAIVYGALRIYFSSIVSDGEKYKQFDALYKERVVAMENYVGTKTQDVNLGHTPAQINTNLFSMSIGGS